MGTGTVVFLNPAANRGRAGQAQEPVAAALAQRGLESRFVTSLSSREQVEKAAAEIAGGARDLIAVGGDGTLQALIDAVMTCPETVRRDLRVGAVGAGTSNDFHKPLAPERMLAGFPACVDPAGARAVDVLELEFTAPDGQRLRHFLLQSSHLGIIPAANYRLTHAQGVFRTLYQWFYLPALMTVSAYEILFHRGFEAVFTVDGGEEVSGRFSGISMVKRGAVAGNFFFKTARTPSDGLLDAVLCRKVSPWRMMQIISEFEASGFEGIPEVVFRSCQSISCRMSAPVPIDGDGEIFEGTAITWRIHPAAIRIMG